ncbi:hypothetical protein F2P56_026348 [Juglans regia]|uniref:Uncharacterized protein n=1 Tax=Juglans regia TaxID=51240 RepID=A0A833U7N9_JUGRE|nr:hypothetical protein F2P56_026348 [Juglans regia]
MSVPDKEIFNAIGTADGVHSRDAEDDDDDSGKKQRGERHGGGRGDGGRGDGDGDGSGGCTIYFTKAKQVVLRPFTKAKKQLLRKMNRRTSSSSCSAAANAENSGVILELRTKAWDSLRDIYPVV